MNYLIIGALFFTSLNAEEFVIKELKGGLSGTAIYKMDIDQKSYVLRINQANQNPQYDLELSLNLEASRMGLAPVIAAVSSNQKIVLMEFIDQPTLTLQEGSSNIPLIADTLQKVHSFPLNTNGESLLSKASRCHTYLMDLDWTPKNEMAIAYQLIKKLTAELKTFEYNAVCLHGDLNPRNIFIAGGKALLIDWAESSSGDPFSDLTYLSLKLDFNPNEELQLLEHYLGRPALREELKRFHLNKKLHLAFWSLTDLYLANIELQNNPKDLIVHATPLKEWRHYQEIFANGHHLSAQYFFERSKLNLIMALIK